MHRDMRALVWFVVLTAVITAVAYSGMDGRGVISFLAALFVAALASLIIVGGVTLGIGAERKLRE